MQKLLTSFSIWHS